MYSFWHELLKDKKGGEIFTLFGSWHWMYIILTAAIIVTILILQRKSSDVTKEKTVRFFINFSFALYIADFFLMPLAYGYINIEKLPFHVCTAMCTMCFLSYHVEFLKKYRLSFAFLGGIANTVYLICPAGVMWQAVHPLSYRVIQTLVFHSTMSIYGFLILAKEHRQIEIKKCYRDLAVILAMTVWSLIGNYVYNGELGEYSHFFNWFFVVRDPFNIFPEDIAKFIMPFLNVFMFFAVELLIHFVIRAKNTRSQKLFEQTKQPSL